MKRSRADGRVRKCNSASVVRGLRAVYNSWSWLISGDFFDGNENNFHRSWVFGSGQGLSLGGAKGFGAARSPDCRPDGGRNFGRVLSRGGVLSVWGLRGGRAGVPYWLRSLLVRQCE